VVSYNSGNCRLQVFGVEYCSVLAPTEYEVRDKVIKAYKEEFLELCR
jgi:hypothetical protein